MVEFFGFVLGVLLLLTLLVVMVWGAVLVFGILLGPLMVMLPVLSGVVGVLHMIKCWWRGVDPERDLEFQRAKMEEGQWRRLAQQYKENGDSGRAAECERMAACAAERAVDMQAPEGRK